MCSVRHASCVNNPTDSTASRIALSGCRPCSPCRFMFFVRTSATSANPSLVSPRPWQNTTRPDWIDSLRGATVTVPSEFRSVVLVMMVRFLFAEDDGSDSA
jgi:hypothetical protein